MFIAALFTITKICKHPRCPSVEELQKQLWYIYTMEYYSALKKKQFLPFEMVWMNLEHIMVIEISHSEKEKSVISLICGI